MVCFDLCFQKMVCQLAEKGVAGGGCRAVHKKTGDKGLDRATQEGCRDKPVVRTLAKPVSAHSRRSQDCKKDRGRRTEMEPQAKGHFEGQPVVWQLSQLDPTRPTVWFESWIWQLERHTRVVCMSKIPTREMEKG